jgi:DNA recombination protein RmuC
LSNLSSLTKTNDERLSRLTESLTNRLDAFQKGMESSAKNNREELSNSLKLFQDQFRASVTEFNDLQKQKFDNLTSKHAELSQATEQRLDKMRDVIEVKLKSIQDDNSEKLERMRQTVDEKLQKTLEERLGESFKIVSDRLEQVYKGLGEMQTLAAGVGDLKKVLSNVKTRGTLGEYQLDMILDQILAPEQYDKAVITKPGSRENVEFVIKLPSKESENEILLLPVDSKFPKDKYQAVLDAYDSAEPSVVDEALKELERTIRSLAKDIKEKYINPPITTDFAIMFLPFEGLYAEVVKRPALFESLQRDFKISIVGPSTFAAFLHSLQMGFRTLAIQKRSSEVWDLLGAVKTEFGRFATVLEGVDKSLQAASNKIQDASRKSRTIERKLKNVEALPQTEVNKLLTDDSEINSE